MSTPKKKKPSRQAVWAKKKRAARGLKKRGRQRKVCPVHPAAVWRVTTREGRPVYVCSGCEPKRGQRLENGEIENGEIENGEMGQRGGSAGMEVRSGAGAVLRLTLKRRWFDLIASGEKREEYREPGRWILSRLEGKEYAAVEFRNGYQPDAPVVRVQYLGWSYGHGRPEWGGPGPGGELVVVIRLGERLKTEN